MICGALNAIRTKHHEFGGEFLKCKNMIKEVACYVTSDESKVDV